MKNKIALLAILFIATTFETISLATDKPSIRENVTIGALKVGSLCFIFFLGFLYGKRKYKKLHMENKELMRIINEYIEREGEPSYELLQKMDDITQELANKRFCREFHMAIHKQLYGTQDYEKDADGVPLVVQDRIAQYKKIVGEEGYAQFIKKTKTTQETLNRFKTPATA